MEGEFCWINPKEEFVNRIREVRDGAISQLNSGLVGEYGCTQLRRYIDQMNIQILNCENTEQPPTRKGKRK